MYYLPVVTYYLPAVMYYLLTSTYYLPEGDALGQRIACFWNVAA
jgi:hypothetical protein